MAFDAGMVSAIVNELENKTLGARVERVNQPEKDEIVLLLHAARESGSENLRLPLSSGTNNPHFNLTKTAKENPAAPQHILTEVGVGYRMAEGDEAI